MRELFTVLVCHSILLGLLGCATPRSDSQVVSDWEASLPEGFIKQLDTARASANAYYAILAIPRRREFQRDYDIHQIGNLVTIARVKYAQWKNCERYTVPSCRVQTITWGDINYSSGLPPPAPVCIFDILSYKGYLEYGAAAYGRGQEGGIPAQFGRISTSNGKVIFAGPMDNERKWRVQWPFSEILEGDRINTQALIKRVKALE